MYHGKSFFFEKRKNAFIRDTVLFLTTVPSKTAKIVDYLWRIKPRQCLGILS